MNNKERGPMSAATANLPSIEHNDRLSRLFAEHYRRVLMAAYRIAGNLADAEDVAQAIFLRLGAGEIPQIASIGSYLYRAAINGSLDLLRRRKAAPTVPLESAASVVSTLAGASPELAASSRELGWHLR